MMANEAHCSVGSHEDLATVASAMHATFATAAAG